jgi:hypothetical protein
MADQVIKQALVWTKQETQLSYEIENRIIAGYLGNTVKVYGTCIILSGSVVLTQLF